MIIFYDGECGLCQRSISILMGADRKRKLLFAPINGKTYLSYFKEPDPVPSSVLLLCEDKVYKKSDVFIELAPVLGGLWRCLSLLRLIPKKIRDAVYDRIAAQRKKAFCRTINVDERFLP